MLSQLLFIMGVPVVAIRLDVGVAVPECEVIPLQSLGKMVLAGKVTACVIVTVDGIVFPQSLLVAVVVDGLVVELATGGIDVIKTVDAAAQVSAVPVAVTVFEKAVLVPDILEVLLFIEEHGQ